MMEQEKEIENALNNLIAAAAKGGGHVYVVDKRQNAFALKLTEPVTVLFYGGYREELHGE